MNSPEFYLSRKNLIDERLEQLSEWSYEQIEEQITERWESSSNITACPANWGLFTSLVHFLGLVKCFSGHQLSGICRRLMTNHRHTRSGFPGRYQLSKTIMFLILSCLLFVIYVRFMSYLKC